MPIRSASFHGRSTAISEHKQIRRPKTHPDLLAHVGSTPMERKLPRKVVVNVTVQRSLGAVHVMASTDWTVNELITATVKQYCNEERRPMLPTVDSAGFDLHYSQFSLESLDANEKLIGLGSRNFFLCTKQRAAAADATSAAAARCNGEGGQGSKVLIPWVGFMEIFL